jgi:hypothetical protein
MKRILPCALMLGVVASCHAGSETGAAPPRTSRLQLSRDGRFLVREDGAPFFWLGDTAWGLPLLGPEDVRRYLDDRAAKRFTVIQVDCDGYGNPNSAGERPFVQGDPDTPHERYWSYLDFILDEADRRGLVVALTVMWGAVHSKTDYSGGYLGFGGDARKAGRLGVWIASGEYDSINRYAVPVSAAQKELFDTLVTWTHTPAADGGTLLRLEHSGFTDKDGFAYKGMSEGWGGKIAGRLKELVSTLG